MARERFDFVLIDTPPVLAVTDPCAVAARVDGVLLTLRIRKGCQAVSKRALEMLNGVEANVLGTIVNGVDEKSGFRGVEGGYGKYGKYGVYSDRMDESPRRRSGIKLRQTSLR
jgi:Mrp family chromosome partitioning ATPase